MKLFSCKIRLEGSVANEVRKSNVTVPEIMLLRAIHGEDAVLDIKEVGKATTPDENGKSRTRTSAEERQRLYDTYASPQDNVAGEAAKKLAGIRSLFGPDHMPLPMKTADLDDSEGFAPLPAKVAASKEPIKRVNVAEEALA